VGGVGVGRGDWAYAAASGDPWPLRTLRVDDRASVAYAAAFLR
jgi:hypothetical protein